MSSPEDAIRCLIHASARALDDRDHATYLALFTDDGEYSLVVRSPELASPMTWMQNTKTELADRITSAPTHEWEIMEPEQSRIVSVDLLDIAEDTATASSSIAVFSTDDQGRSTLYVVGRYDDRWRRDAGDWRLAQRQVVLRTRWLSMPSPMPI